MRGVFGGWQESHRFLHRPRGGGVDQRLAQRPATAAPLTHDLYLLTLQAFGAKVSRAVIVNMESEIYYARLILEAENEIMERKIIELDARPSDCLALAVRCGAPFYVVRHAVGLAGRHVGCAGGNARKRRRSGRQRRLGHEIPILKSRPQIALAAAIDVSLDTYVKPRNLPPRLLARRHPAPSGKPQVSAV